MFGFININKPKDVTSHKVISVLRKITGEKQIGHAGTLDPIASGVLPVAIGKASKLIDYLPTDKRYSVGMYLGFCSDTYDTTGKVVKNDAPKITREQIEKVLNLFRGNITQIPPAFSAVHYNGKRLYELARKGNIPKDIPSREITVYSNNIINFDFEKQALWLEIECSKGTYIRSIVNDIGVSLRVGAVMFELTRTLSAGMDLSSSLDLTDDITIEDIRRVIIPPQNVIEMDKLNLSDNEMKFVSNGNKFKNKYNMSGDVLLLCQNRVVALAGCDKEFIFPKKVLL